MLAPAAGPHECRWRFCKTRQGVRGHFVKVRVGGVLSASSIAALPPRSLAPDPAPQVNHWPSLHVSRLPDGGFQMENEWVVYRAVLRPSGPYCRGIAVGQARHLE